jgi:hypothetical protein
MSDSRLHALSATNGTEKWCFDTEDSATSPIVANGTVYIGSDDHLYALDATDGTEKWRFEIGTDVTPLTVAQETIYVGGDDRLYALDATDGTEKWRFDIEEKAMSSLTVTVAEGTVYVGNSDSTRYSAAAEQATTADINHIHQDPSSSSPTHGDDSDSEYDSGGSPSQQLPVDVAKTSNREIPSAQVGSIASPPRRTGLTREDMTIIEQIGSGGQAIIQKARLPESEQPPAVVALREPDTKTALPEETVKAFESQADTLQTIDARERDGSEHITGVIATSEDNGLPWVAMEYMDGGDLAARLEEHPDGLPVREALWFGEGICRGLEVAHSLGYVHLDVTPANVLLKHTQEDKYPWPKLADWGLAHALTEETETLDRFSINYAAPEQFDPAEFGDPDQLTDIYQAGALMYALLTGEPPATGTQLRVMQQVLSEESFTPPNEQRPELPEIVDAVIGVALERDKTARYNSIHSFKKTLNALRTGGKLPSRVAAQFGE